MVDDRQESEQPDRVAGERDTMRTHYRNQTVTLLLATVACLLGCLGHPVQAEDKATKPNLFVFENGVRIGSTEERVKVLKELGYQGIGSANPRNLPARLKHYDKAGLGFYSIYVGVNLTKDGPTYDKQIAQAIKDLKGRDTVIELYVRGKPDNAEEQAVQVVRELADLARASGLKVVLYPHSGFYVDTIGDATRVARKVKRDNVGVMFNLCHFLMVEPKSDLRATLEEAKGLIWRASLSGAEKGGRSWGKLIQTLDQGNIDQQQVLNELRRVGFTGAIGLQCYAIRGDARDNLKRSIEAWKKLK